MTEAAARGCRPHDMFHGVFVHSSGLRRAQDIPYEALEFLNDGLQILLVKIGKSQVKWNFSSVPTE